MILEIIFTMFLRISTSLNYLAYTIVIIQLCLAPSRVQAFQCYVCDSKNDIECTENLPNDSKLQPQECNNIIGAKYCVKTTNVYAGSFSGELGTKRFCASNDHGNYCRYVKQPTGDREYRSCVITCNTQNCNSAPGRSQILGLHHHALVSIMALLSLIIVLSSSPLH